LEVGEGVHKRPLDTEESHDEEFEAGSPLGSILGPWGWGGLEGYEDKPAKATRWSKEEMRLEIITEYRKKEGGISSVLAWDDLTGMRLDTGKVKEARAKEMQYVQDKVVYNKIPRTTAVRNGSKVVQTRWIDINKEDDDNPIYRSRLVGKRVQQRADG